MNEPKFFVIADGRRWEVPEADVAACKRIALGEEVSYFFLTRHPETGVPVTYVIRYQPGSKQLVCTCPDRAEATCQHRRAAVVVERIWQANWG